MNFGRPVTVRRAAWTTDDYGNAVRGPFSDVATLSVGVAPVDPAEVTEFGRRGVDISLQIYTDDPAVDVEPHDQIVISGDTFEVVGDVQRWENPLTGWRAGARILLNRMEG